MNYRVPYKTQLTDTNLVVTLMSIRFASKFLKRYHSVVICAMNMRVICISNSFYKFIE
jgi:hypothetical protein